MKIVRISPDVIQEDRLTPSTARRRDDDEAKLAHLSARVISKPKCNTGRLQN